MTTGKIVLAIVVAFLLIRGIIAFEKPTRAQTYTFPALTVHTTAPAEP